MGKGKWYVVIMSILEQEAAARLLGEDFTDIRPLGENGGLSNLYRAHKKSLDIDVVVKRMKMDPTHPADVQREARIMTSLRHQYLPRIFDLKTDQEGYCYTVMEFIPGGTLRQYIQRHGAIGQGLALRWLRQLCQAAAYMHSQEPPILHSDIKPENIMITPQQDICLIDFNVALELREYETAAIGATAGYAAPEQYNIPLSRFGKPKALSPERRQLYEMAVQAQKMGKATERTDLYAIGATAYYMLTGYDPAGWNVPPIPLERYDIELSDSLRQVIERCMEKMPARRFSSANEVLRAFDDLPKMDKRYRTWRRSARMAALLTGAGFLLSCACTIWGWMTIGQEKGAAYNSLIQQTQGVSGEDLPFSEKQSLLLKAIAIDRKRPEAYANLGALLYGVGDYQQAVDLLSLLEPEQSDSLDQTEAVRAQGQVQYVLASCYYKLENYDQALRRYQLAAALCPEEAAYQRDLAVCSAKTGNSSLAEKALNTLAGLSPQAGDVELVSGEIAYAGGHYQNALELLCQAMDTSQEHEVISRASLEAAECCRQLGSDWTEEEIRLLENAAGRLDAAENYLHLQRLSEAYIRLAAQKPEFRTESYERALAFLEELTARGQPSFAVRQNTALVLEYLDRFEESEAVLLQLQQDYPQDYRPSMRLALLYADWESTKDPSQRSYSKMLQLYEAAKDLFPVGEVDSDMVRLEELAAQLGS